MPAFGSIINYRIDLSIINSGIVTHWEPTYKSDNTFYFNAYLPILELNIKLIVPIYHWWHEHKLIFRRGLIFLE